ncbi:MAG: hydrolase [Pseudomonadota bacterium]
MAIRPEFEDILRDIDGEAPDMIERVKAWSAVNSGSFNMPGLEAMADHIETAFAALGGEAERLDADEVETVDAGGAVRKTPRGALYRLVKRPQAPYRVLLCGHMDTVFGVDHPFQSCRMLDDETLNAPGAADMKGGLIVMLHALKALEKSPFAEQVGYEVLINADEEIGSLGSARRLTEAAERAHFGMVFEPALPDGTLAGARKGSGNFTIIARGRAAHAGREHHLGRNALVAVAEIVTRLDALNGLKPGVTVNPAKIEGGGPNNVVPDMALCRFNIRVASHEEAVWAEGRVRDIVAAASEKDGVSAELHGGFYRAPKPMDEKTEAFFNAVRDAGAELGLTVAWRATGGCCDGNNLAAAGLPVVDTLGVRGGAIHSAEEFVKLDSFAERAKLSALLLLKIAAGDIPCPGKIGAA